MPKKITSPQPSNVTDFTAEIKSLIDQSRQELAVTVNSAMSMLYWQVGKRINEEILKQKRAEYGKQIVVQLAQELGLAYGSGWGEKQLRHCLRFAEIFPTQEIIYTLCRQLSWSHLSAILPNNFSKANGAK